MKIDKKIASSNYSEDKSLSINIPDNGILMGVAGEFDKNLKELEKLTGAEIYFRGNSIIVKGHQNLIKKIKDAIYYLIDRFKSEKKINRNDIISSLDIDMVNDKKNQSSVQAISEVIKTPKKSVIPRSKKQKEYVSSLKKNNITMSLGPAGTGKTYLAVAVALSMLLEKKVERIILSRPAVEAGERLGFLPGDMKDKVDPYLRPLYDSLYELFDYEKIQRKIESGVIEIAPLAFMRGRTLKNSFAILDEAQNATSTQIKMFLTRIGENSSLVVNGDPTQIDLPNKSQSGLVESRNILKDIKEIGIINFDHKDVIRHPLVTKIVEAYNKNNNDKG